MFSRILRTLSGEDLPVGAQHSGVVVIMVTAAGLAVIVMLVTVLG